MANRYVNQYIAYVGKQERSGTMAASEFLGQKAVELRKNLQESEAKLAAYRQQASVMRKTEGVKDTTGEKLTALNTALAETEVKLTRARYELEAIESAGSSVVQLLTVQPVAQNPQVSQKRIEISALEAQLTPLLEFCGPKHPRVVGLTNELRGRKGELNTLIASVVTMARQEVSTLSAQLEDFKRQVSGTRGDVIAMGDKEIQEKMLIDQVELDRQMYQNISMRMNQADLTGQFTDNGILRIADVATPPDKALKPNKTLAALASMMVFGLVFVGVPLGWGLADDHIIKLLRAPEVKSDEVGGANEVPPVQPTSSPANAELPAPPPPMALGSGNRTTVLAEFPILAVEGPAQVLAECLRSEPRGAATSLRQLTGVLEKQALYRTGPGGVVLVSSSESGEGKSLAAAALAATFVHHGRKVLVIDCHAGAPGIHHFFPQSERHSSFASRLDDVRYGNSDLFVLPAHDIPAYETNELLDGYRAWIDRARLGVDWIILDGPPVLKNFADVAPLAPLATDVIMIHDRARATPAKLRAAMTLLQPMMSSTAMRGLVINRAE
jgi:Mrp family chromosome partitioning ATPase